MQINGVDINYFLLILIAGGLFLATGYHFILYIQRKTILLGSYSQYLGITFSYVMFRTIFTKFSPVLYSYLNPDELIQMAAFAFYIRFMGIALQLEEDNDRKPLRFVRASFFIILGYMCLNTILVNLENHDIKWASYAYLIAKILIRAYLLSVGFFMIIKAMKRRKEIYYSYIASGAISMIFFGLISTLVSIGSFKSIFGLAALTWLVLGFFVDVMFFSAAVGYRIRLEYEEKEYMEIERVKSVYAAREEERNRIARDIHDEMGSSISSIAIYAKLATALVNENKEKAISNLNKIEKNAVEVMEKTYETIWALQSNYGAKESIFQRMTHTAEEMLSVLGIDFRVSIIDAESLRRLPFVVQKNYWLVFKEALNNVCKYSKAAKCEINVGICEGKLTMKILDDGIGFDPEKESVGNGLTNMNTRAKEIHAELTIKSSKGNGTCITMDLFNPQMNEIG